MLTPSTDLLNSSDIGGYSTDPTRPDYACPAYVAMAPRWSLVKDVRGGTDAMRAKKEKYLPRFEAESDINWAARILLTFASETYASTIAEHVGLVSAEPIKLGDDVPKAIAELMEDVDGEGNHLDVFAATALDAAMDLGHCVLFTDYPDAAQVKTKAEEKAAKLRPYVQLYAANDVLAWDYETVGGVRVLVRIMLRECGTEADGEYGSKTVIRYREIRQAATYDEFTGRARGLGAITWRAWKYVNNAFDAAGEGTIIGPDRITARVVYGGEKLGLMMTKPHLYGLAQKEIEETQQRSDYKSVMHKCNVPTPYFIGRTQAPPGQPQTVKMGEGIDIPAGGAAPGFMEPAGTALGATRDCLMDLKADMLRMGASTAQGEGGKVISATEAAQAAKARNARVRRAARSLQDALEGMLADFAAFMGLAGSGKVKSGGSLAVNQNFAGLTIDPQYLSVLVDAYREGTLTIEELRYVLQTGQLPEDFDPEDVLALIAAEAARQQSLETKALNQPPVPAAA